MKITMTKSKNKKKMKNLFILFTLFFLSTASYAQNKKENLKAKKRAFITQKLNLSVEESEKFWPIYNEYETKKNTINRERKQNRKELKNSENLSDAEVAKLIDKRFDVKQKDLNLEKEYNTKFQSVLPAKKVVKLQRAEEQFKKEVLKALENKKRKGPPSTSR